MSRIGINGFGRVGRSFLRRCIRKKAEVVAINDPNIKREYMAYLIKHDSTNGRFKVKIDMDEKYLIIDDMPIRVYNERNPAEIKWGDEEVDYVVECSGQFSNMKAAKEHIKDTVKRVVISSVAPSVPTFVCGVNLDDFDPKMKVISNASCTTNCMAPLLKILNDKFIIEEGLATTIHALTSSQSPIDSFTKSNNWSIGRGGMQNVIPTTTGSAKALCRILPELSGKINAMSFRVPIANVSTLDLTVRLQKAANFDYLKELLKEASEDDFKGIISVVEDESVSTDFIGSSASCIFDARASMALNDKFYKFIAWYDNEYGYSCRLLDLLEYMEEVDDDESSDDDEGGSNCKDGGGEVDKAEEEAQKCMAALDAKDRRGKSDSDNKNEK